MLGSGMALYDGIAALHESAPAGPQAEVYARLSENIAKLALPDSATIIAKEVLKLINKL